MRRVGRHLDLQAKIFLILVAVIVPTFVVVTLLENQFTKPVLEDELRQVGITSGKTLAAEILTGHLLQLPNPTPKIESHIQELLYAQPNVVRMDVVVRDPVTNAPKLIATNIEEDPASPSPQPILSEVLSNDFKTDEMGDSFWEIHIPIEQKGRDPHGATKKFLGTVHVVMSIKLVGRIVGALARTTAIAAGVSVVLLIVFLSYFLRKTIANDRLLRQAESQNLQLTEQLHEAQRQLMNTEKLAVMGQLTASFAHEIGTPLTAIGGHLGLLREEIGQSQGNASGERLQVIEGQVSKIESIVKGFLQSTAKPPSQTQLVDINRLVDKTLGIVRPRMDSLAVDVKRNFDRSMGPMRVVPLDLEQILLNLLNNSLDSINSKFQGKSTDRSAIEVATSVTHDQGREWVRVSVFDTGEGIKKTDLRNVLKPFFTTKRPGEGTGLGLTICQEIAHKYGGELEVDSKEGQWTRVTVKIPYQVAA